MRLDLPVGSVLLFCFAACALESTPDPDPQSGGTGGTSAGTAGSKAQAGGAGKGGSSSGGASGGTAGSTATGGKGGTATAGTNTGGSVSNSGGAGGSLGGSSGTGGASGGSPPMAGNGGVPGGSGGSGGNAAGSSGAGGSGGSGGGVVSPSDLPVPPGDANQPRPSGTPGEITVVNWAGFKGAVTYTFDDNNSSQISRYADMQALGVPYTFFLWTGKSEAQNAVWQTAKNDGHELANHTQSHSSNGNGADIDAATQFIEDRFGVTPYTMAAPNGAGVYTDLAKPRFIINRGVSNRVIAANDNTDPFTLPTYIPPTGASTQNFNSEVDSARSAGGWRTMCIHGFTGGNDGAYQPVPFENWQASVEYAKGLGDMWIGTLEDVGAYWLGQKAFSDAESTTSGTERTFTWTLPDNFPPGKYLRVRVDGGTLKQGGTEIPWDPHGYYEIALDAGSVTLSP